jgi:diguanylate cyclase (GGDEF)-like protein
MTAQAFPSSPHRAAAADRAQRARVEQSLLAVGVYAVFALIHEIEVGLGLVDATSARVLSVLTLGGAVAFYLFVRSGLHSRWFSAGPANTARDGGAAIAQAQCLFGVLAACAAYAVNGPARGAVLLILLMILVFAMFELNGRDARRIGVFALLMFAATMAWTSHADPVLRDPRVEFVHFAYACIGVATVVILSGRLNRLRGVMVRQKADLEEALGRIYTLAIQDELTGLVNRRHMTARFEAELARHARSGESMSVALLDIDLFKHINDRHGHWVGDSVLRGFARVTGTALRASDVLARWGGEEFLVLLPGTRAGIAEAVLERMRLALLRQSIVVTHPELRVTFSAGIATLRPGDTPQSLIERADAAMYQAKRQGRNQSVVRLGNAGVADAMVVVDRSAAARSTEAPDFATTPEAIRRIVDTEVALDAWRAARTALR